MNNLQIKLRSPGSFRPIIKIDDKDIKLKKNEFGSSVGKYSTEKDKVEIKIYTLPHEFDTKYWFLLFLLYYIVSIFGIFDVRYSSNLYRLEYSGTITLQENTILDLVFEKRTKDGKALSCKEGPFDDNESNVYIYNPKTNKRIKIALAFKVCSWVLIAISVGLYFVFK